MYPDLQPPPLSIQVFYVLLALSRTNLHAYAIRGAVYNCSRGSVNLATGRLYRLISHIHDEGFIEQVGSSPAGKSGKIRMHYGISGHGLIRLQEELLRMKHAIAIAENNHLLENKAPTDIQRLLLNAQQSSLL